MKKFIINTDGASRGNPGSAAASFVIKTDDGVIWVQEGVYLGQTTNNEAEYQAVLLSFKKLKDNFSKHLPAEVEVRADSLLIVKQLKGDYKIKNEHLMKFNLEIKKLEKELGNVTYTHIPREENFLADKLANITLDNNEKRA